MRFLLCILAVILTYQSVNAQSLWRNSATTNRVPWVVSGSTNIIGTITNPIVTAGSVSSTGGFTSAGSNYFGTVQSTNILDPSNVKYWGAKGDGVTDDTAAIQAAINAVSNTIYFPSGRFQMNSRAILKSGIRLYGDGTLYSASPETLTFLDGTNTANVTISGLTFDLGHTDLGCSINLFNPSNLTIENCNFIGGATAVELFKGQDILVSGNNCTSNKFGIVVYNSGDDNGSKIQVVGNRMERVTLQGIQVIASNAVISGNVLRNCGTINDITQHAIYVITRNASIINNVIENQLGGSGVQLYTSDAASRPTDQVVISGNVIDTTGSSGIIVVGHYVTISGNHIRNPNRNTAGGWPGLYLYGQDLNVLGNTLLMASSPATETEWVHSYYGTNVILNANQILAAAGADWGSGVLEYPQRYSVCNNQISGIGSSIALTLMGSGTSTGINISQNLVDGCGSFFTNSNNGIAFSSETFVLNRAINATGSVMFGDYAQSANGIYRDNVLVNGGGTVLAPSTETWQQNVQFQNAQSAVVGIGGVNNGLSQLFVRTNEDNTTLGTTHGGIELNNHHTASYGRLSEILFSVYDGSEENWRYAGIAGTYTAYSGSGVGGDLIFSTRTAGNANLTERMRINNAGNITAGGTITATNGFFLPTQTAPPAVAGGGTLWNSNSVLYWITATKTNMVSDGR